MSEQRDPWWLRGLVGAVHFMSRLGFFGSVAFYAVIAGLNVGILRLLTHDPSFGWPMVVVLAIGLPIIVGGIDILVSRGRPPT